MKAPRLLEIRTDADGVVSLIGEFDLSVEKWFTATARAMFADPRDCVLDLSQLTFMDSSGLRAIVGLATCEGRPRRVVLRNPGRSVRTLLEMVGVDERLGIYIEDRAPDAGS